MTTKLTLTIEDKVIGSAKKYAKKKGQSLSNLVEAYLKSVSKETQIDITVLSPKVLKLMGVIKLPKDFDYKKDLTNALVAKYKK